MGTSISKYLQKRILFLSLNIAFSFSFSIAHHFSFGKSLAFYSVNNIIEKRRSSSSVQQKNNNTIKAKSSDRGTDNREPESITKWIKNLWEPAFGPDQEDNNSDRGRDADRGNSTNVSTKKAYLENPGPGSKKSGIGMVSGWACDAETVEIEINGNHVIAATYGVTRTDTVSECGDTNNGFTGLMNWNLLNRNKKEHSVRLLINGEEFSRSTFTVTSLGQEFLTGVSGEVTLDNFPTSGNNVKLVWQQAQQNFILAPAVRPEVGTKTTPPFYPKGVLEIPHHGSLQSGIGMVSGWVCDAETVEVEIGGKKYSVPYGKQRADTAIACGDINNGFNLLMNWNILRNGVHTAKLLVNGEVKEETKFIVTTLGQESISDVQKTVEVPNFPSSGKKTTLEWQQSIQNFVITEVSNLDSNNSNTNNDNSNTNNDNPNTNDDNSNTNDDNPNTNDDNPNTNDDNSDTNTDNADDIISLSNGFDHAIDNTLKGCDIVSTDLINRGMNLSDYWAQRAIGADLLKEELEKEGEPSGKHLIGVIDDSYFSHSTYVSNLISGTGKQAVLPEIGNKKSVFSEAQYTSDVLRHANLLLDKADQDCSEPSSNSGTQNTESDNE